MLGKICFTSNLHQKKSVFNLFHPLSNFRGFLDTGKISFFSIYYSLSQVLHDNSITNKDIQRYLQFWNVELRSLEFLPGKR